MRKVFFVTGIRSEYDILYSIIRGVGLQAGLEAGVIVTGAHLAPMYGCSYREILKDGFRVVGCIESLLSSDTPASRVKSAAIQLAGLVDLLSRDRPTFLVAPMDREEAITVALAGAYMQIPVVHIGGGETAVDANVDNAVRHAATKLAHLHMVSTRESADRVIRLGEEPWRVHVVGAAGLDRLLEVPELPSLDLWERLHSAPVDGPFAMVVQHPTLPDSDQAGSLMSKTLDALLAVGVKTFVGFPNSDPGSQQIVEVIERYAAQNPAQFHAYRNLPRLEFVSLLRRANVLVGNSSLGITEAPLLGLPVVNVGPRQRGREHAENVQFVDHDVKQIEAAIHKALYDKDYRSAVAHCSNPYGDGKAGRRVAAILADQPLDERLLRKVNTF